MKRELPGAVFYSIDCGGKSTGLCADSSSSQARLPAYSAVLFRELSGLRKIAQTKRSFGLLTRHVSI